MTGMRAEVSYKHPPPKKMGKISRARERSNRFDFLPFQAPSWGAHGLLKRNTRWTTSSTKQRTARTKRKGKDVPLLQDHSYNPLFHLSQTLASCRPLSRYRSVAGWNRNVNRFLTERARDGKYIISRTYPSSDRRSRREISHGEGYVRRSVNRQPRGSDPLSGVECC